MRRTPVGSMNDIKNSEIIERENDQLISSLQGKVAALKSLTIDIGTEVGEQNKYLNGMDNEFDFGEGLLGNTMKRLQIMAAKSNKRFTLYLVVFGFGCFLLIYYVVKWRAWFGSE
eukprot:sb/3476714/